MSNTAKKFKVKYEIEFSGHSRGWDGEQTFQEKMVGDMLSMFLVALEGQYKTIKIRLKKTDFTNNDKSKAV